jgi:hypothetical protein
MALVNQGGKLLLRNGVLATGQACCCDAPCVFPAITSEDLLSLTVTVEWEGKTWVAGAGIEQLPCDAEPAPGINFATLLVEGSGLDSLIGFFVRAECPDGNWAVGRNLDGPSCQSRKWFNNTAILANYVVGNALVCQRGYRIVSVPIGANGVPDGELVIEALPDEDVGDCSALGLPSITFSSMP